MIGVLVDILPYGIARHAAHLLIILGMLVIFLEVQLILAVEMDVELLLPGKVQQVLHQVLLQIGSVQLLAGGCLNEGAVIGNNRHIQLQLLGIRQGGSIHAAGSNGKYHPGLHSPLDSVLISPGNLVLAVQEGAIHICNK